MNLIRLNDNNFHDSKRYLGVGRSQDSIILDKEYEKILEDLKKSISIKAILNAAKKAQIENYLQEIYDECSSQNWDAYDAQPVSEETIQQAKKLLNALMSHKELELTIPDICADPEGEITLEWRLRNRYIFMISINAQGRISYAGLYGENKNHGTERFEHVLPDSIISNLKRLYS